MEKSRAEERPWLKNKKRIKNPVKKRNKFLCESDWYWRSSTLASRFQTKKSPSNQNLPYIMLKARFSFLYASLCTKTSTIARSHQSPRIWKLSVDSLSCSSAHFPIFPSSPMDFPLPLATLLIIVMSFSSLHWPCLQWVTFPGRSWFMVIDGKRSRCPIGCRFHEAR